jgi:hypothetical protein
LIGLIAFRLRMSGTIACEKAVAAGALLLLYALSADVHGLVVSGVVAALMVALCTVETVADRRGAGSTIAR